MILECSEAMPPSIIYLMAYTWIHVVRRFDPSRGGFFYLYRFPYDRLLVDAIKNRISKEGRFWYPPTKAWHVAERYSDIAEKILCEGTGLKLCPTCMRGDRCKSWDHLKEGPDKASTGKRDNKAKRGRERAHAQDRFWEYARTGVNQRGGSNELPPTGSERWYDAGKKRTSAWALRVLGLRSIPSKKGLKEAFRNLVMEYHPDRHGGDHTKMALINSARDYLDLLITE